MPKLGLYGSVRGALSNERPYRDPGAPVYETSRAMHTAFTRQVIAIRQAPKPRCRLTR